MDVVSSLLLLKSHKDSALKIDAHSSLSECVEQKCAELKNGSISDFVKVLIPLPSVSTGLVQYCSGEHVFGLLLALVPFEIWTLDIQIINLYHVCMEVK